MEPILATLRRAASRIVSRAAGSRQADARVPADAFLHDRELGIGNDFAQLVRGGLVAAQHDDGRSEVAGHRGDHIDLADRLAIQQHILDAERTIAVRHDAAADVRLAVLAHICHRGEAALHQHRRA